VETEPLRFSPTSRAGLYLLSAVLGCHCLSVYRYKHITTSHQLLVYSFFFLTACAQNSLTQHEIDVCFLGRFSALPWLRECFCSFLGWIRSNN